MAIIARYEKFIQIEKNIAKNVSTIYLSGFFIIMIGAAIIASHNIWLWDWPVIITLLGWAALIKGTMRILFPETVVYLINKKVNNYWFLSAEISFLMLSAYLLYQGFFGLDAF